MTGRWTWTAPPTGAAEAASSIASGGGSTTVTKLLSRLFFPLVFACLALLAACGDDDDADIPDGGTAEPTAGATQTDGGASPEETAPAFDGDEEFSTENALEYARVLSEDIGSRAAASEEELEAAQYIRDTLASFGYEASLQPFDVRSFEDQSSNLMVIHSGGSEAIETTPFFESAYDSAEGEIVFAGIGEADDFPTDTSGNIALIQRGDLTFTEKVDNASGAGAVAAIIFNDEPGPFMGQLSHTADIPAATISGEDGLALLDLMEDETLTASFTVDIGFVPSGESNNVLAQTGDECRTVVGGHYDSVPAGPGANDNASGTAVVMEIARTLAARGETDGVCFALFGAEEVGLQGSEAYVETLSGDELDGLEAMLNFDMLGVGDGWPIDGSTELVDVVGEAAEGLDIPYRISALEEGLGSDHAPFIDAGVPAVIFNCFCDPNYHTSADRFSFLEEERMEQAGALGLGLLAALMSG